MNAAWEDAIKRGDIHTVLDLIERGADVNARDRYGQTALMLAAHAGYGEIVEALIAHRADLNITAKFGLSALMLALVAGHADIAHLYPGWSLRNPGLRDSGYPVFRYATYGLHISNLPRKSNSYYHTSLAVSKNRSFI